jgi:hypothetical protein
VKTQFVIEAGTLIFNRRPLDSRPGIPDLTGAFLSTVPTETRFSDLVEASRSSSEKMLQLADALMFGTRGWRRNPKRASNCYRAAALGCSESETEGRQGIPVGLPEAMVATASVVLDFIKTV